MALPAVGDPARRHGRLETTLATLGAQTLVRVLRDLQQGAAPPLVPQEATGPARPVLAAPHCPKTTGELAAGFGTPLPPTMGPGPGPEAGHVPRLEPCWWRRMTHPPQELAMSSARLLALSEAVAESPGLYVWLGGVRHRLGPLASWPLPKSALSRAEPLPEVVRRPPWPGLLALADSAPGQDALLVLSTADGWLAVPWVQRDDRARTAPGDFANGARLRKFILARLQAAWDTGRLKRSPAAPAAQPHAPVLLDGAESLPMCTPRPP